MPRVAATKQQGAGFGGVENWMLPAPCDSAAVCVFCHAACFGKVGNTGIIQIFWGYYIP